MKKLLLLTALICASPVLNVAASAETMYKDLVECVVLSNSFISKQDQVESLRRCLMHEKAYLQDRLMQYHCAQFDTIDLNKLAVFGMGGVCLAGVGCYDLNSDKESIKLLSHMCVGLSGLYFSITAYILGRSYIETKLCTRKIKEIDAVIVKLDALADELAKEQQQAAVNAQ